MPSQANESQQAPLNPLDLGGFHLQVGNPLLRLVHIKRGDEVQQEGHEPPFHLTLGVSRLAAGRIVVDLTLKSEDSGMLEFEIGYRLAIEVVPDQDQKESFEYDRVLRDIAARIGPVVLYPYLRETLSSFSLKAGLTPLVLPVMNVGTLFDPETIELPPVDEETSAE